ncbi:hypothetical protein HBI56_229370 [Parastagonospora nodorum]|uniref:DH domain-containing protein n=1 Tax=Phaeosphaeria nodorum (strain SN15 / ATCC MYA-4574 / FGSC 10173) TaxID=321614 RepID=A0A7U2F8U5_PHANO|nr:hypothetical protein HBH56_201750 [Parastagonospora nodorum]QRD00885.1 hypothetical protein JI435_094120 [Parastagonospora nodorum SN15]KAH3925741.1 hypothetical protein HBH54_174540 [Parastagonospora nodorum]KAH3953245.1 hypothetical protein HBH53_035910 [Parastagonospora nodorum]KAH3976161.1 hypothetical protein HBH52_122750 [Parastagonospora nodorum]
MEPISAVIGIMAALPQAIQSAKELYDLRSRYKDASVLITAIYSESMVIAASLSQVQNLLNHDALQSKPQLLETFDRALTGCRVVYGCLEEEVRDLVVKAEADDLKFKDRAKFLWKEDTFKELLTQIRGQQSALSLLIQGLQMESIADIRKLVEENSVTLDRVVKRSRTLRLSHPRVHVPESLFSTSHDKEDAVDAVSLAKSTEFAFDDEVVNSKAYRRAMHLYTSTLEIDQRVTSVTAVVSDLPPAYEPPSQKMDEKQTSIIAHKSIPTEPVEREVKVEETKLELPDLLEHPESLQHETAFVTAEQELLPYMPRITSTAPHLSPLRANTSIGMTIPTADTQARLPIRSSSEGNILMGDEPAPPLPPRRPSGPRLFPKTTIPELQEVRTASSDDSIDASVASSVLSNVSCTSSRTTFDIPESSCIVSRKPLRKPLPLRHQISSDILRTVRSQSSTFESPDSVSPLQNAKMHNVWLSIIDAEQNFVDQMLKFRKMFYDNVLRQWPQLKQHLGAIIVSEQLAALNKATLLQSMEQQVSGSGESICDSTVFEQWANQAHKLYREYCQAMPHTASSLRTTQNLDAKFDPFVNTVGLSLAWFGMGWEDYLKLPMSQLNLYIEKLESLVSIAEGLDEPAAFNETIRLKRTVAAVRWLSTMASSILSGAEGREETKNLEKLIYTMDSDIFSQLHLLDSTRRVKHQGKMAIKMKSQGSWQAVHVILLDNFLLWGKVKPQKKNKGDRILVLDTPIAIDDLDFTMPCEDHQFQKTTMFDDIPRGSVLYIITVKRKTGDSMPHMLGAFGFQERNIWLEHFTAATGRQNQT